VLIVRNIFIFYGEGLLDPSWRTTPCRLSAAAYSIAGSRSSIHPFADASCCGDGESPYIRIFILKDDVSCIVRSSFRAAINFGHVITLLKISIWKAA
jgi:hypothetical protein